MKCSVILDLLPLYIDDSCSVESRELVEAHLKECGDCRAVLEEMQTGFLEEQEVLKEQEMSASAPALSRVESFRASLLQSGLLYLSFAGIILGVTLEAATPSGAANGLWAMNVIVPVTGFMLALANWYFLRLYKNRGHFARASAFLALAFMICGCLWVGLHYGFGIFMNFTNCVGGFLLSMVLINAAWLLAKRYGALLGKE